MQTFKSILQFSKHFSTDDICREHLEASRWGGTPACPFCGSINVHRFANNNRIFKCREKVCRKKFSVTVGTIYENSKIPLTKWYLATYIITTHSKGISSLQLANMLDVTRSSKCSAVSLRSINETEVSGFYYTPLQKGSTRYGVQIHNYTHTTYIQSLRD